MFSFILSIFQSTLETFKADLSLSVLIQDGVFLPSKLFMCFSAISRYWSNLALFFLSTDHRLNSLFFSFLKISLAFCKASNLTLSFSNLAFFSPADKSIAFIFSACNLNCSCSVVTAMKALRAPSLIPPLLSLPQPSHLPVKLSCWSFNIFSFLTSSSFAFSVFSFISCSISSA